MVFNCLRRANFGSFRIYSSSDIVVIFYLIQELNSLIGPSGGEKGSATMSCLKRRPYLREPSSSSGSWEEILFSSLNSTLVSNSTISSLAHLLHISQLLHQNRHQNPLK